MFVVRMFGMFGLPIGLQYSYVDGNNIIILGTTCTHSQRQRAEGEYFVIPRANFFLMFYCPFRKKRYNCRRGALNNLNCRKPQKRSRKPIAGLRQIM